ncbi:MAG TPA: PAS domain S-box protein [Mucilaginibacter sp.]|jgi:PAS domain S-box-containing protein
MEKTGLNQNIDRKLLDLLASSVKDHAIVMLDPEGHIITWNKGAENIKGYREDEIIGQHLSVFYTATDNKKHTPRYDLNEALRIGSYEVEGWRVRKDGSAFWANVGFTPLYGDDKKLLGFAKIIRDITASKKTEGLQKNHNIDVEPHVEGNAENVKSRHSNGFIQDFTEMKIADAQLEKSRVQLEEAFDTQIAILNALPPCVALLNADGEIVSVNNAWKKFTDSNNLDLSNYGIGYNYIAVPEKVTAADKETASLIAQGIKDVIHGVRKGFAIEYPCDLPSGKRWFRAVVAPLNDKMDKGVVVLHINITDRKQAELELLQRNNDLKLLESVVTNATDSIIITEAEPTAGSVRILYVNQAFTKMTGYNYKEVIGRSPEFLLGPKTDKEELNRLMIALDRREPCEMTIVNYRKNGEEFWVNFSVVPVADEGGRCTHWIAIQRDVTKLKSRELQKALLSEIGLTFNENQSLNDCLNKTLKRIAEYGNFGLTEFYLVSKDKLKLNLVASFSKNQIPEAFIKKTAQVSSFFKGEGLIGRAWETQKIEVWHHKKDNNDFKRALEAKRGGFKRAYVIPLLYNNEVIGVLTMLLDKDESPDLGFSDTFEDFNVKIGAEVKRKQLEDELNQIFNFSPDVLCIVGVDGYFKKINPAMCELLGYSETELMSRPFAEFIHPEDVDKTGIELKMIEGGKPSFYFENRYVTKTGKVIWLSWTATYAPHDGVIFAVAKNITEKKELEELLDKAIYLSRIGAWEVDLAKGIVHWSDMTREIHEAKAGFEPDIETAANFYMEGGDRDTIMRTMEDAAKNGTPADVELRIITAKGNIKWIRVIVETEFVDGKCVRLYGSFQDIDDRKRAEVAAVEVLNERNIILESIGDAFFAVDNEWKVTYWNNMAEKVLGKHKDEILSHNLWDVYADSINSESYKKYHLAVETKQAMHFQDYYPALAKWYEISAYPTEKGLSVYFKDITDRKASEIKLHEMNADLQKHARELAISNAELEQFAYVASHDLQEPLRMVTSFLTQLEKKYGEVVDAKGRQYIYFAVDGAKRMRQIILDLLNFSTVGRTEDDLEWVDFNKLMNEIVGLYRRNIEEFDASIVFKNLPVLEVYKTPVRQVFQNLISNSLKYHRPGVKPVINISCRETKLQFEFAIADNGIGIAEEYFDKIFIIFQRLHNKDEYSGTGMGLAIAKKIIENLGGKIWAKSVVGEGSTFYFTILKNNRP